MTLVTLMTQNSGYSPGLELSPVGFGCLPALTRVVIAVRIASGRLDQEATTSPKPVSGEGVERGSEDPLSGDEGTTVGTAADWLLPKSVTPFIFRPSWPRPPEPKVSCSNHDGDT
jgi:hypothetical protein